MENLLAQISEKQAVLNSELEKFAKGNKAAGQRARKATLELTALYKEFRKESVK